MQSRLLPAAFSLLLPPPSPSLSFCHRKQASKQANKQPNRRAKQQRWPLKILENVAHVYFNQNAMYFFHRKHTHTLKLTRIQHTIKPNSSSLECGAPSAFRIHDVSVYVCARCYYRRAAFLIIEKLHKDVNCVWRRVKLQFVTAFASFVLFTAKTEKFSESIHTRGDKIDNLLMGVGWGRAESKVDWQLKDCSQNIGQMKRTQNSISHSDIHHWIGRRLLLLLLLLTQGFRSSEVSEEIFFVASFFS